MHELLIARSIVESVRREMTRYRVRNVTAVHVAVGGLSHVVPDNLVFCFDSLVKGTELEGTELVVDRTGIIATCKRCGRTFPVRKGDFRCPDCHVADVDLSGDSELTLTSIEAETDDEED